VKLQVRTTFDFGKLAKYVASEAFTGQVNRILGSHIAESSKRFIMQGKVTPRLEKSTIKRRPDVVCPWRLSFCPGMFSTDVGWFGIFRKKKTNELYKQEYLICQQKQELQSQDRNCRI